MWKTSSIIQLLGPFYILSLMHFIFYLIVTWSSAFYSLLQILQTNPFNSSQETSWRLDKLKIFKGLNHGVLYLIKSGLEGMRLFSQPSRLRVLVFIEEELCRIILSERILLLFLLLLLLNLLSLQTFFVSGPSLVSNVVVVVV